MQSVVTIFSSGCGDLMITKSGSEYSIYIFVLELLKAYMNKY